MRYEKIFPWQVREAIEKNSPVFLSIGVLEYHSEHLSLGVDTQIIEGVLERLEEKHPEIVILPPCHYGTASYAVAPPENRGTISIDSQIVCRQAEEMFRNLLRVGFRNIHGLVYHQTENFNQGMPTDLAFRFAGRRAVFAFLERERGEGWWGDEAMSDYYNDNNPFEWIMIHALAEGVGEKFGGDHAGKVETSAMMALYPDCVDMTHFTDKSWFAREAAQASKEFGDAYVNALIERLETRFSLKRRMVKMLKASGRLVEKHLDVLTNEIGVRLAGSKQERSAADYLHGEFQRLGLKTVIEEFPIWEKAVEYEKLELRINGQWAQFGCSLFGGSPGTENKELEADLVFFESMVEYQRTDLSFLTGKAVVHLGCHIENETDYQRLMAADPAFLLFVDIRHPGDIPLADGLFPSHVARFGAKPTVNVAFLDAWNWKKSGADKARLRVKGDRRKSKSQNVIAEIAGTNPTSGIIFAGAHHDTQSGSVGADDNAVACAAVLELANILKESKLRPTVRLISFGAEEQLSAGSAEYVRKHRREIEQYGKIMVNFDSFGSLMGWTAINFNGPSEIEKNIRECFQKQDIYCRFSSEVIPYTDQFPFAAAGVPGMWIYKKNCTHGRFFHHSPNDTMDKISCELSARHIDAAAEFITEIGSNAKVDLGQAIPQNQADKIKQVWELLFGGWEGLI